METLRPVLIAMSPDAKHRQSFREGNWDGNVEVYENGTYPAGLNRRVIEYIQDTLHRAVEVIESTRDIKVDAKLFPRTCAGLKLWDHQYEGAMALLRNPRGCIKIPTAGGKTLLAYALCSFLFLRYGLRSLIVTSRKGLARQTAIAFHEWAGGKIKIGQCGDGHKVIGDITVATASTLQQYQPRWHGGRICPGDAVLAKVIRHVDVLFYDECFPAGTLIDGRPIETIREGDLVRCWNHRTREVECKPVLRTFQRRSDDDLVDVKLVDGSTLQCTAHHPIWSESRGDYVAAILIDRRDLVLKCVGPVQGGDPMLVGVIGVAVQVALDERAVYNFEVKDRNNYFANGVLVHNCHHGGSSDTWYDIGLNAISAAYRWGASGTPLVYQELADMRLMGVTGPVVYSVGADKLIHKGHAAKPKIAVVLSQAASGPRLPQGVWPMTNQQTGETFHLRGDPPYADLYKHRTKEIIRKGSYRLGVIENAYHNATAIRCVEWLVERGRQTLLICRRSDHFNALKTMLENTGIAFSSIEGKTPTFERDAIKKSFNERRIKVMLASEVMGEGENVRAIGAIVLADGMKANTPTIQRIGRGMRLEDGGDTDLWVVDIVPMSAVILMEHGLARCESYEREGYEVRVVETWPAADSVGYKDEELLPFLKW